jgi:hypothetical protein
MRVFLLLLALLASIGSAQAQIGTPTSILTPVTNSASGTAISTTVDTPIGSLIVVAVSAWNSLNGTVTSVTDSAGNSYTAVQRAANASEPYPSAIFYSSNTPNDLPNGGTITATNSGGVTQNVAAYKISGANGGIDVSTSTFVNGNTTLSLSSGVLAVPNEILIGVTSSRNSLSGFTAGSPFTELLFGVTGVSTFAYDIVSATTSVTYGPSWTNNGAMIGLLVSFKQSVASGAPQRMLTGVGK